MQGFDQKAAALNSGDLSALAAPERLLLDFVRTVTQRANAVTDAQVDGLREAGWSDAQIAEAVYITALFALFTRLADAFGIQPDPRLAKPRPAASSAPTAGSERRPGPMSESGGYSTPVHSSVPQE
ncbi:MAG: carboxymuconolactone decarboxylase family protein [Actinomycetota bacterium]